MKDPELDAYVDAIEALLTRRLGAERTLSPRDFALARSWHRTGVPLGDVLAVIEESFASGHGTTSLAFCRSRVEARARVSRGLRDGWAQRPRRRP